MIVLIVKARMDVHLPSGIIVALFVQVCTESAISDQPITVLEVACQISKMCPLPILVESRGPQGDDSHFNGDLCRTALSLHAEGIPGE